MQTLEIKVEVDQNHEVYFTLPNSWKSSKVKLIVVEDTEENKPLKKREFGGLEGKIHISDDFDDELPDSFWLGKDT
jgi:hypothetical protein